LPPFVKRALTGHLNHAGGKKRERWENHSVIPIGFILWIKISFFGKNLKLRAKKYNHGILLSHLVFHILS